MNPNIGKEWLGIVWEPPLFVVLVEVDDGLIIVWGMVPVGGRAWRWIFSANPTLNSIVPFADMASANCLREKNKASDAGIIGNFGTNV